MTWKRIASFAKEYAADRSIAAVSPSSAPLIGRLLRRLRMPDIRLLVELGPGDGAATRPMLDRLSGGGRLIAIERNPRFAAGLKRIGDPRLLVIEDDARRLRNILGSDGLGAADAVVASIPFTYLSDRERRALLADARSALRPGGLMIIFHQYTPLMLPYLKKEFGAAGLEFEPLNLFPCFLMTAEKTA